MTLVCTATSQVASYAGRVNVPGGPSEDNAPGDPSGPLPPPPPGEELPSPQMTAVGTPTTPPVRPGWIGAAATVLIVVCVLLGLPLAFVAVADPASFWLNSTELGGDSFGAMVLFLAVPPLGFGALLGRSSARLGQRLS